MLLQGARAAYRLPAQEAHSERSGVGDQANGGDHKRGLGLTKMGAADEKLEQDAKARKTEQLADKLEATGQAESESRVRDRVPGYLLDRRQHQLARFDPGRQQLV